MRRKQSKETNYTALFIGAALLIAFITMYVSEGDNVQTESIVFTPKGIDEPTTRQECEQLQGICIPPQQETQGYTDFGACDTITKCVVADLCEETGGVFKYQKIPLENSFSKTCVCPAPTKFELNKGCTIEFN